MVGRAGLEPATSRLSGVRSNHLSYRPLKRANALHLITVDQLYYFTWKGHEDGSLLLDEDIINNIKRTGLLSLALTYKPALLS